jgi:hypothetical protein
MATRPHITVVTNSGKREIRYDANHLSYVIHDGKYCLTFVCSGQLTTIPIREVAGIEVISDSKQAEDWCGVCDQRLESWPIDDPEFGDAQGN